MIPMAILCGGRGKRLAPITTKIPKSLVPVLGKPFIYWQLELLAAKHFEYVVLCVGHMADQIQDAVGNGNQFGLDVDYSYDETPGQGTVKAIRGAFEKLGPMFCTLYGDSYLPCSYQTIIKAFRHHDFPALMTVYRNQDYGLGVFLRVAFVNDAKREYAFNLINQYKHLYKFKKLFVYNMKHRFYEIGSYPGLTQTEEYLERHPVPLSTRVVRLD
jgi:NDP-sugar pyrophosphorylase family protein